MENIFDILLILFIAYALLSPFFKKKKPQQIPKRTEQQQEHYEDVSIPDEAETTQDVLAEIEDLLGIKRERETFPDERQTETEVIIDGKYSDKSDDQFKFKSKGTQSESFKFKAAAVEHIDKKKKIEADFAQPMLDLYNYDSTVKLADEEQVKEKFDISFKGYTDLQKGMIFKEILDKPRAYKKYSRW